MDWKAYWNSIEESDFFRQVGRTHRQQPYSEQQVALIVDRICTHLKADRQKRLLDLCCGNGLFTKRLSPHFGHITALDFSERLIEVAKREFAADNVDYHVGDATELGNVQGQYDCVLVNGALQYFDHHKARLMFSSLTTLSGASATRIYLGEVADRDRRWNFYRGLLGRFRYYQGVLLDRPIIGHWWSPADLLTLAQDAQMELSIFYQSTDLPNYYFRYDALLIARGLSHRDN